MYEFVEPRHWIRQAEARKLLSENHETPLVDRVWLTARGTYLRELSESDINGKRVFIRETPETAALRCVKNGEGTLWEDVPEEIKQILEEGRL